MKHRRHCWVWRTRGDRTHLECAHCGQQITDWWAVPGDNERVTDSQDAHRSHCRLKAATT
jgi:hypothetical protein